MTKHIVVVGAGPAGYVAALRARQLGAIVSLIGAQDLGGTCLQRGCIPTKTLIASCKVLSATRHADAFGLTLDGTVSADWGALRARMTKVSGINEKGIRDLLSREGVDAVSGTAKVMPDGTVEVGSRRIRADGILVATGSKPWLPPTLKASPGAIQTSDDVLSWDSLPSSVAIVGGGVIACEFAFILNSLGCKVTVLEQQDRPLPNEDQDCSQVMLREMKKRRIRFIGKACLTEVRREDQSTLCYRDNEVLANVERVVVAVGRIPNSDQVFAVDVNVSRGARGEILVDEYGRTSVPKIYAAGDVTGRMMLAHAASAQAKAAVEHMLGEQCTPPNPDHIPRVTYTDPEVACVGLTEQQARDRYGDCLIGHFDLRSLGMAHALNELSGFVKVIASRETHQLLGVHIIGAHASEMIHEAVALITNEDRIDALTASVHAHPTLSEAIFEAAEDALGHCVHKPSNSEPKKEARNESAKELRIS